MAGYILVALFVVVLAVCIFRGVDMFFTLRENPGLPLEPEPVDFKNFIEERKECVNGFSDPKGLAALDIQYIHGEQNGLD